MLTKSSVTLADWPDAGWSSVSWRGQETRDRDALSHLKTHMSLSAFRLKVIIIIYYKYLPVDMNLCLKFTKKKSSVRVWPCPHHTHLHSTLLFVKLILDPRSIHLLFGRWSRKDFLRYIVKESRRNSVRFYVLYHKEIGIQAQNCFVTKITKKAFGCEYFMLKTIFSCIVWLFVTQ